MSWQIASSQIHEDWTHSRLSVAFRPWYVSHFHWNSCNKQLSITASTLLPVFCSARGLASVSVVSWKVVEDIVRKVLFPTISFLVYILHHADSLFSSTAIVRQVSARRAGLDRHHQISRKRRNRKNKHHGLAWSICIHVTDSVLVFPVFSYIWGIYISTLLRGCYKFQQLMCQELISFQYVLIIELISCFKELMIWTKHFLISCIIWGFHHQTSVHKYHNMRFPA